MKKIYLITAGFFFGLLVCCNVKALVINYSYDDNSQLTEVEYNSSAADTLFYFDDNGNLNKQEVFIENRPTVGSASLTFPELNSEIHASVTTNIVWKTDNIIDKIDATNLTISRITLHYADTTNFILEVTNNVANSLGEIEWTVPAGSWDGKTNYVLKFEVVDSSSLTNNRVFFNDVFVIVPEPIGILWIFGILVILIKGGAR